MASPWEKYAAPSPEAQPGVIGRIAGAPKPEAAPAGYRVVDGGLAPIPGGPADKPDKLERPQFIPQGATQMMMPDGTIAPVPNSGGDDKDKLSDAIKGLGVDELLTSVSRAKKNLGSWWSTGLPGDLAGNFSGSPRNNLIGNLESLKGALIMEKLQALKDASKTGASGMGAMSEREGDRLAAAVAALSPDMSQDELETSLSLVEEHARALKDISEGRMPAMSLADFQGQMSRIVADKSKPEAERLQAALALAQQARRGVDPEQIRAAIAAGGGSVVEDPEFTPPNGGGLWSQFGEATGNTLTGIGQGIAAIPDALTNATGAVLSLPARAFGADWVADQLMNPITIGGTLERANPTPQDGVGRGVRLASQIGGGVAGFPQRAANALASRVVGGTPPPPTPGNALNPSTMQAADQLSASTGVPIQPLAADVAGATTRRLTSMGAQLPFSAAPIVRAGQRLTNQTQQARDVIASRAGNVSSPEMAGESVKTGLTTFRTRTSQQARTMYQTAEEAAGDVTIQPKTVLERLGEHIRQEAQVPGGTDALPILERLATDLSTAGTFSISGVRGMRSALMSRLESAGMTPNNSQRIVNDLVRAAGDDINQSLTAAGKSEAAKAYRSADKFWAERMDVVNNAIKPIIGRNGEKSGEEVVQGLQRAAKGNTARLSQIMRALPEDDAATVRGTLISQLGKSAPGVQNAEGSAFSLNQFLTHWNQMTPRARSILFDRGLHDDLNRLATVADGSKQAGRYANSSNTGGVIGGIGTVATIGVDFMTLGATALAQYGGGRLLAAPGFARWLARTPKSPAALPSHVKQLTKVATRNPAIADEIAAFGENLLSAANNNVPTMGRAAASDGTDAQPY